MKRHDDEQWVPNAAFSRAGPPSPQPVYQLANLTSEIGGGQYNWQIFDVTVSPFSKNKLWGARSGTCYELSKQTGLPTGSSAGANVLIFYYRGIWFFQGVPSSSGGGGGGTPGVYGDASDGDLHFTKADNLNPISYGVDLSGYSSSYPAANYGRSSTDWIHTVDRRVLWCNNLTIDAGVVVIPAWTRAPCTVFVDGTLTLNGELSVSGDDRAFPIGITGGQGAVGGTAGGGGSLTANGSNGAANDGPIDEQSTSSKGSGAGGNAGAATGGLGSYSLAGAGGYLPKMVGDTPDANDPSGRAFGNRSFPLNLLAVSPGLGVSEDDATGWGSDGGGGAASVSSSSYATVGGNGGPGGGRLTICARAITGSGKIRAEGGRGQPGVQIDIGSGKSGDAGGGGAGNGGVVLVFSDGDIGAGITVSVIKGAHGGAGVGSGSAGASAGADGYKRCYTKTRTYIP